MVSREKEWKPRGAIQLIDFQIKRENDGLTGREYAESIIIIIEYSKRMRYSVGVFHIFVGPTVGENL